MTRWSRAPTRSSSAVRPAAGGAFDICAAGRRPRAARAPAIYHAIWTGGGALIDRSDADLDVEPPAADGFAIRAGRRELAVRATANVRVLVGRDLADARADIWTLAWAVGAIGLVAAGLALAGGWWLAGRALAPIDRINRTARAMAEGDFAARIPVDRVETELGQVAPRAERRVRSPARVARAPAPLHRRRLARAAHAADDALDRAAVGAREAALGRRAPPDARDEPARDGSHDRGRRTPPRARARRRHGGGRAAARRPARRRRPRDDSRPDAARRRKSR